MNPALFPDPEAFKPSRWIEVNETTGEEFVIPQPPGFQPWSSGPRICPGMKFAQVEFTATLATVLRAARVEVASKDESVTDPEKMKEEVLSIIRDSRLNKLTLGMLRPEDLVLRIVER